MAVDNLWWFAARASGLLAWTALVASTALGLLVATGLVRMPTRVLQDRHRDLSVIALGLVAAHLVSLVADSYVHFGLLDLAVPFVSSWRPAAVAFGVIAAWSLIAVAVSTALRASLPNATWRTIHLASYLAYVAATIHLLSAGADSGAAPIRLLVAGATGAIAALTVWALRPRRRADRGTPVAP